MRSQSQRYDEDNVSRKILRIYRLVWEKARNSFVKAPNFRVNYLFKIRVVWPQCSRAFRTCVVEFPVYTVLGKESKGRENVCSRQ